MNLVGSRKTIIGALIIVGSSAGLFLGHLDAESYKELILATLAIFAVANYSERAQENAKRPD